MKNFRFSVIRQYALRLLTIISVLLWCSSTWSQKFTTISGKLRDNQSNETIQYANIALFRLPDSVFVEGQISDTSGFFCFRHIPSGNYRIIIAMAGYERLSRSIDATATDLYDAGFILLNAQVIGFQETIVTAERLKGKSDKDKTLFFVTKRMTDVSSNGLEAIKLIPGVRVDFRRNISLEASQNILIMVDGIERDNNYLSQIRTDQIDRFEIINAPQVKYDGNITGVINIILKKEKAYGFGGQINMEIPSVSKYYLHPDYNLSFVLKKFNFYTSYNGELIKFDQQESLKQKLNSNNSLGERNSDQYIEQKLWSHRFHYGIDFPLSPKSYINVYGFFNPYSQKYSGTMETGSGGGTELWRGSRVSADNSTSTYYSVFLKHKFNEKGNDLSFDINNYNYSGEYTAIYTAELSNPEFSSMSNNSHPGLNAFSVKIDLNTSLSQKLKMCMGTRWRMQTMKESNDENFLYTEKIYAVYGSLAYSLSKLEISSGLRMEKSISELKNSFRNPELSLLPFAMVNFKISDNKNFRIGINRTISRPNLYQLNPIISWDDPYNTHSGNPFLNPELRTAVYTEFSGKFKSNFFSARLFYNRNSNVIGNLFIINDSLVFKRNFTNTGTIHQSGLQLSGTFTIGRIFSVVPYLKFYSNYSDVNNTAKQYSISDRQQLVFEPGLSSIISFKNDINVSMVFQYSSPRNSIQGNSFSDAFYSISVEKLFLKKLKAGIVSALPITGNFTYQGSEVRNHDFYSKYSGNILLSGPLFWFKLSYHFNSGNKPEKAGRTVDEGDLLPKKGF